MNTLLLSLNELEITSSKQNKTVPVPLLYLASNLRKYNHVPTIFNLETLNPDQNGQDGKDFYFRAIHSKIRETDSQLIGINCFTSMHFQSTREVAQSIRNEFPNLSIVIGGVHPTLFAKEILENCAEFDFVVLGEGENQVVSIADFLENSDYSILKNCQALGFRDESGAVRVNPRKSYIRDLDSIPMASWDLLDIQDYYSDHSTWFNPKGLDFEVSVPIVTTRSCPFNCNFCTCYANMGRTFRRRSPNLVVDEIEYVNKEFGQTYFRIVDDNFVLIKEHATAICKEIIRRKLAIQFEASGGLYIASLDEEVIDLLAKAGCVFAPLPVEHGNDMMRNIVIGKNLQRESIFDAVKIFRKYDIFISGTFVMGFPEDTVETLEDTYQMILDLELDSNYVFTLIPFAGTKVFNQAVRDDLFTSEIDLKNLWQGHTLLDLSQDDHFYIKPYNMSLEELHAFKKKFNEIRFFSSLAQKLNNK